MLFKLKLNFLLLLLLNSYFIFAQEIKETSLKGKPRFVLEESFGGNIENNIFVKTGKDRQISWMNDNKMEFDKNGNLIRKSFYNDYREFIHAEIYEFNNAKLYQKKYMSFLYFYSYDHRGNSTEVMVAPITDSMAKRLKHRYAYDAQNRLSDSWEYDFNGGLICHQKNTYDENGLLTKEFYAYRDGNEYKTFSYDSEKKLAKTAWFDEKIGLLERTTFTYQNGYKATEFWEGIEKGKVETSTKYEFDENGNILTSLDVNPKRQIHDYEVNKYVFDQHGNWVKKTIAVNDSRFYIVERIIAYY